MMWSDYVGDTIRVAQQKTATRLTIPLHEDLKGLLAIAPRENSTILATVYKKPFSVKGFGNMFSDATHEAGLPRRCVPHGLRKAAARRLAEAGCSASEIMAITGHKTLAEVERYTRAAEQERLARQAIKRQSESRSGKLVREEVANDQNAIEPHGAPYGTAQFQLNQLLIEKWGSTKSFHGIIMFLTPSVPLILHQTTSHAKPFLAPRLDPFLLGTSATYFRTNQSVLLNRFFCWLFFAPVFQDQLNAINRNSGRTECAMQATRASATACLSSWPWQPTKRPEHHNNKDHGDHGQGDGNRHNGLLAHNQTSQISGFICLGLFAPT